MCVILAYFGEMIFLNFITDSSKESVYNSQFRYRFICPNPRGDDTAPYRDGCIYLIEEVVLALGC